MSRLRRQLINGYTDMGRPRVPPLPQNIVMTDRFNGQQYFLTHTGSAGFLVLELSTNMPRLSETTIYGPYAGPYYGGYIRLYVQNATLLTERIGPEEYPVQNPLILTRRGNERRFIQITVDDALSLVYTEVQA